MPTLPFLTLLDAVALAVFLVCWIFYEALLKRLARGQALNGDMAVIRTAWMQSMAGRSVRLLDGQLMNAVLSSASFFASSNLILIAAASSALFGARSTFDAAEKLVILAPVSRTLFEVKLALVVVTLARGLLAFIWAIRQMNYLLAVIGATPETLTPERARAYGQAAAQVLEPCQSSFNAGVRGYYFALAGAAWLLGPVAFLTASLGATALLVWRQRHSGAARGVRRLRALLESEPQPGDDVTSSPATP